MTVYAYVRVSTDKQQTDNQLPAILERFPNLIDENIRREKISAMKYRPELEALLASLQRGDTLVIYALDRLGRKAGTLIPLMDDLQERGINLISLREGLDYSTTVGKMVMQVLSSVAEMERNFISERTKAALSVLKQKGVKLGAKFKDPTNQKPLIVMLVDKHGFSFTKIAQMYHHRKSNVIKWYYEAKGIEKPKNLRSLHQKKKFRSS